MVVSYTLMKRLKTPLIYKSNLINNSMKLFNFEDEKAKEFEAIGLKDQSKSLTIKKQVGTTTFKKDFKRKALAPGKRISSSGKIYYETRKNRSDQPGKKI